MNKHVLTVLLLTLLFVGCGDGGDAVEGQAFWQSIVAHLVEIAVVFATPLLLILARKLIQIIEAKTNVQVAEHYEVMVNEWVGRGIAYAHEQSRKALKADSKPLSGDEKKVAAVDFIAEGLRNTGVVSMGSDALAKLVESKLNMARSATETIPMPHTTATDEASE